MTTATRAAEVIDALFDSWSADPAIQALPCAVFDGPFVRDISDAPWRLHVGSSGLDEDDDPAVTVSQRSPHANDVARDEEVRITCSAWYGDGDVDMRAARAKVRELLDLAVAMPRRTQNLGLVNVFYVGFDDFALRQLQSPEGAAAIYTFVVVVRCRIYT